MTLTGPLMSLPQTAPKYRAQYPAVAQCDGGSEYFGTPFERTHRKYDA